MEWPARADIAVDERVLGVFLASLEMRASRELAEDDMDKRWAPCVASTWMRVISCTSADLISSVRTPGAASHWYSGICLSLHRLLPVITGHVGVLNSPSRHLLVMSLESGPIPVVAADARFPAG